MLPASLCAKIMVFRRITRIIEVVLNERAVTFGRTEFMETDMEMNKQTSFIKVTVLQTDIVWEEAKVNRMAVEQLIEKHCDTDLFVLPEMFSTGFSMNPMEIAEDEGGETLQWMCRIAALRQCAIAGSLSVREAGNFYNRFYFVCPDGTVYHYDKRHLFGFGGEDKQYTSGDERVIVSYKGFRFLLQICYDLRFPVWSRCQNDYDAVIYVANWPASRREVWNILLKARALENQCYVIGVNRVGNDPLCLYDGGSMIISPYGKILVACTDGKEEVAGALLAREPLDSFRKRFPVLGDGDDFELL